MKKRNLLLMLLCTCGLLQVKAQTPLKVDGFDGGIEHLAGSSWNAGLGRSVVEFPASSGNYVLNLTLETLEWGRVAAFTSLNPNFNAGTYRYLVFDVYRTNPDIKINAKIERAGDFHELPPINNLSTIADRWERLVFDFGGNGATGEYDQMQIILNNVPDGSVGSAYIDNIYYSNEPMTYDGNVITVATSSMAATSLTSLNGYIGKGNIDQTSSVFGGNWNEGDFLYWNISVPSTTTFTVTGRNAVDIDASFVVDLTTVPATQSIQKAYDFDASWVMNDVNYGDLTLPTGTYQLKLTANRAASTGWRGMNLENITLTAHSPTDMQKIQTGQSFKINPNPFTESITIESYEELILKKVELINQSGITVAFKNISSGSSTVLENLNNLPKGVYFLKITTEENITTHKVIKR